MHHPQWQDHGTGAGTPEQPAVARPALFAGKTNLKFTVLG